jgi:hypothetical protein
MILYHFTCSHGYEGIGSRGLIRPYPHFLLGVSVLWLTSEAWPDREETGLTQSLTKCDRMAYRYRIAGAQSAVPWLESEQRKEASPSLVDDLERYGAPEQWWISPEPLRGRLG